VFGEHTGILGGFLTKRVGEGRNLLGTGLGDASLSRIARKASIHSTEGLDKIGVGATVSFRQRQGQVHRHLHPLGLGLGQTVEEGGENALLPEDLAAVQVVAGHDIRMPHGEDPLADHDGMRQAPSGGRRLPQDVLGLVSVQSQLLVFLPLTSTST